MNTDFLLIICVGTIYTTMLGLLSPTVPLAASVLGATTALVGLIASSRAIIQSGLRMPMGESADRFGWELFYGVSFILGLASGVTFFIGMVTKQVLLFIPAQILWGLTAASFRVTEPAYISEMGTESERPQLLGRYLTITGIGQLIGPPIAGWLIDHISYEAVFMVFTCLAIAGFFSTLPLLRKNRKKQSQESTEVIHRERNGILESYSKGFNIFRTKRNVALATFGSFLMTLCYSVGVSFHPLFLRGIGLVSFEIGILLAVRDISAIFSRILTAKIMGLIGNRFNMFLGITCISIGIMITPTIINPLIAIIPLFLAGFGFGIIYPSLISLVAVETKREERGLAMGVFGTGLATGFGIGSIIFGIIADIFSNLDMAFILSGLSSLFGLFLILCYLFIKRDLKFPG
ncbi:MAG: MFS transporter [Promethearchaeota archaeon]